LGEGASRGGGRGSLDELAAGMLAHGCKMDVRKAAAISTRPDDGDQEARQGNAKANMTHGSFPHE
jgi:hypothetical protein